MKRIMIIGSCGAGKSTLARQLKDILKLPLYHLDQFYWQAGWVEKPKSEWEPIVQALAKKEAWIIDGNYGSTMDLRLERADTVILLLVPTYKALYRVISRTIKYWRTTRPDMTEGCRERFDLEFLHYVLTFNLRNKSALLKKLSKLPKSKRVYIINNKDQLNQLISETSSNQII